jgi:hypothetical protein
MSTCFNHKIKNLLLHNKTQNYIKDISRNNHTYDLNKSIITSFTQKKRRDNRTIPIRGINSYMYFAPKESSTIKVKNEYNKNRTYKNLNKIKVFDELNKMNNINNDNFNQVTLKTIEYLNYNKKRKIFIRNNSFKRLNKVNAYALNKPPIALKNDLYNLDKKFLKEISPINNFIIVNMKKNEYLKEKRKESSKNEDSFYLGINLLKNRKKQKIKHTIFNYNHNKNQHKIGTVGHITKNYINRRINRRIPSCSSFNTIKF